MEKYLFFLLFPSSIFAQSINPSVIASTGATIQNGNNMLTWTLGETVIQDIQSPNNYLSQGFQQPSFSIIGGVNNINTQFDVTVFPNPVSNMLSVTVCGKEESPVEISITDITGKKILIRNFPSSFQHDITLDVSQFPSALYFLTIVNSNSNISDTYKIQKLNK